ncbi:DUF2935 domain-containing protein [Clostridium sp. DJ247]|uniref:DUF2935 domain-containing protein n=1 Tax=Clostridium sp. DJ247 TaxID=2726188 RepID=UPI001626EBA1|nr:DUF2935 domain-containing protein [Clostridium sp. DJ247]MBC2582884.1 DUF2935 domain-containing protein [Clostridium sp. DJ247]
MKTLDLKKETLFEHRFWLQILGDHSRFILDALSPEEIEKIQRVNYFKTLFDNLLENARMDLAGDGLLQLNKLAYGAAQQIRGFKLSILYELIAGKVKINMPPTFLNHMVNELEEYILVLNCIAHSQVAVANSLHYHLLWLPDASGHASAISSSLDMSEKSLIKVSRRFTKEFDNLYLKSIEEKGYTRTGLMDFPAIHKLNTDADSEIDVFKEFLGDLEKSILDKKVLGYLKPLMTDHMYREECYYQIKLSRVSEVTPPACDPTRPRIMD